jgi:asparaginyl-tRNA synthetase
MEKRLVDPEAFEIAGHLGQESAVEVQGEVRKDPRSPIGYEIGVTGFKVISEARDYPITPKEHGTAFLMEHRHLWLRSKRQWAIMRVRATLMRAIRDYLDNDGFLELDAPILTPAACEGTTTLFETRYFDTSAFLSQSGQLYNEVTAMAHRRVYCFGPTFRAEKSKTRRHLMEFWMVEPEMAFADLDEDIRVAEGMIEYIVQRVLDERAYELEILERDTEPLKRVKAPFIRLHYNDAVKQLQELGSDIQWGDDFGGDDETILTKQYEKPVVVHRYPAACKAFYMAKDEEDPRLTLSVDILAPEGYGEIVGGGQREHDYETLKRAIDEAGLPGDAFDWYLDLRRYGSVPHAGFGLGVERTLAWICGLPHVRETIPFPRMLDRLKP